MRNESIRLCWLQKAAEYVVLVGLLLPGFALAGGPPPVIIVQPQSVNAPLLGIVTFSVVASSGTTMSYQWYKDGSAIYGATSSSYTILTVLGTSSGNYYVKVSNAGGWVLSDNATLNVMAPPAIITQPRSQSVVQGQNVSFSVAASGTGPLSYQWLFNGVSMGPIGTNASLTLLAVTTSQAGAYRAVMTNYLGSVTSAVAHLDVLVPAGIATQPQSQSVLVGQNASFSVVASGTSPFHYQWNLKGTNVPGATASTLTLTNVQMNQAGSYSVLVTNIAGSDSSVAANLIVALPTVTVSLAAGSGLSSSGFTFQLSVPAGLTYVIMASSDLQAWTPIATNVAPAGTNVLTNVATTGSIVFTDPAAVHNPSRFYRAVLP